MGIQPESGWGWAGGGGLGTAQGKRLLPLRHGDTPIASARWNLSGWTSFQVVNLSVLPFVCYGSLWLVTGDHQITHKWYMGIFPSAVLIFCTYGITLSNTNKIKFVSFLNSYFNLRHQIGPHIFLWWLFLLFSWLIGMSWNWTCCPAVRDVLASFLLPQFLSACIGKNKSLRLVTVFGVLRGFHENVL